MIDIDYYCPDCDTPLEDEINEDGPLSYCPNPYCEGKQ
jgi:hypothetical protein